MAIPAAPIQFCVLVEYRQGYAHAQNPPTIRVFGRLSPTDAASAGITMRVERCTGAGCAGFAFLGNGVIKYAGTSNPQGEFSSAAVFGTVYRYRIRFENTDGNGPFSAPVEIDTTVNGTAACDTGNTSTLQETVMAGGVTFVVETSMGLVRVGGVTIIIEANGIPLPVNPPTGGTGGSDDEDDSAIAADVCIDTI